MIRTKAQDKIIIKLIEDMLFFNEIAVDNINEIVVDNINETVVENINETVVENINETVVEAVVENKVKLQPHLRQERRLPPSSQSSLPPQLVPAP